MPARALALAAAPLLLAAALLALLAAPWVRLPATGTSAWEGAGASHNSFHQQRGARRLLDDAVEQSIDPFARFSSKDEARLAFLSTFHGRGTSGGSGNGGLSPAAFDTATFEDISDSVMKKFWEGWKRRYKKNYPPAVVSMEDGMLHVHACACMLKLSCNVCYTSLCLMLPGVYLLQDAAKYFVFSRKVKVSSRWCSAGRLCNALRVLPGEGQHRVPCLQFSSNIGGQLSAPCVAANSKQFDRCHQTQLVSWQTTA